MSGTQRASLGWALVALVFATLATLALPTAHARGAGVRAASTWPAGTYRWEGTFKRKNRSDPGGSIQFYSQAPKPLPNGTGKFRLGGIAPTMWGSCKRNGKRRSTLVDFYRRDYKTFTLGAKHTFAFRSRSPAASSGPGKFRITGKFAASGRRVKGTVKGRQRQVLGARCKASGRFTARRKEQVG
jgi:hypothetical protein